MRASKSRLGLPTNTRAMSGKESGDAKKSNPTGKNLEAPSAPSKIAIVPKTAGCPGASPENGKCRPVASTASKIANVEKSKSGRPGKRGAFTPANESRVPNSASNRSQTESPVRVAAKANSSLKMVKGKERSSSRGRQKRKAKATMAQLVKQVRRGKRNSSKRGKMAMDKSEKMRQGKTKSAASGKGKGARSASGRATARKRIKSRSLQQLHVLEKSVFRSRLESQNTSTEPVPFQWVQTQLGKVPIKTKIGPSPLDRTNSESSLVGKSITYRDDVERSSSLLPAVTSQSDSQYGAEVDAFTMEALAEEITHVEANDIFEPGPLSW